MTVADSVCPYYLRQVPITVNAEGTREEEQERAMHTSAKYAAQE